MKEICHPCRVRGVTVDAVALSKWDIPICQKHLDAYIEFILKNREPVEYTLLGKTARQNLKVELTRKAHEMAKRTAAQQAKE